MAASAPAADTAQSYSSTSALLQTTCTLLQLSGYGKELEAAGVVAPFLEVH